MNEFKYVICDEDGIHARPAGEFVKKAKEFDSTITISANGKSADAKKIFGVMGLTVKQGQEITVSADGADEEQAILELEKFVKSNL